MRDIRRLWLAVLIASVILVSTVVLFRSLKSTPFHKDESGWIASGNYYSDLLLKHDFAWENWQCSACGPWGSLNPPIGKLMIGMPLRIFSPAPPSERGADFRGYYDFEESFEQNLTQGRVPPDKILILARRPSAVVGILCCLLVCGIGYMCDSWWTAALAAGLLLMNQTFVEHASRAMTDVHYNAFLLLLCFVSIFFLKARHPRHVLYSSALCGMLAGLACSVKIIGIVVGGGYFVLVVAYKYWVGEIRRPSFTSSVILFAVLSVVTIYALNPYYWPSAAEMNVKAVVDEARTVPAAMRNLNVQPAPNSEDFPHLNRLLAFPLLFVRWERFMTHQQALPSASWHGSRLRAFHEKLLLTDVSFHGEPIFLLIGLVLCGLKLRESLREGRVHELGAPLIYFGVNYLFILFFMRLNWDRYYLPTIIASRVFIAMGLVQVVRFGAPMAGWQSKRN